MKSGESSPSVKEEIVTIDGKKYRRVSTGYTIRKWFSHDGPGWDTFVASEAKIAEKYGIEWRPGFSPDDLPNEIYYQLEEIE